jgi:hypothetical protein
MAKLRHSLSGQQLQYQIYMGLASLIITLTGIFHFRDEHIFQRYTGSINSLIAGVTIIITGFILLSFMLSKGWFVIYKKEHLKKRLRLISIACVFIPVSILVDVKVGFPPEMNILFPDSLLFYPAIAFFVEIIFHVMPLATLLYLLTTIFKTISDHKITGVCIIIVALAEPVYQTLDMFSSHHFPLWSSLFILLNLFLFNVTQ